jgi:hypothetical protein
MTARSPVATGRRAGGPAVSDVPSGQTLRYAAPQRAQLGGERLRTKDGGNEAQDGLQINTVRVVAEAPQDVVPRLNTAAAGAIVGKAISPGRAKQPGAWIGIVLRCCGSATWMSTVRAMRSATFRPSRKSCSTPNRALSASSVAWSCTNIHSRVVRRWT